MGEEKGIKELKELVVFFAEVGSAADKASKDGLGWDDAGHFVPALMAAPKAFDGLEEAKMEAKDLSESEMAEIKQALAEKLDLVDDQLEVLVEKALGVIVNMYGIYKEIQAMRA